MAAGAACPIPETPVDSLPFSSGEGAAVRAGVATVSPGDPGGLIGGAVHPAARSSTTARLAMSMNLIRSILVPHGT
ncbi:MAG: hypothetical protein MIO88_04015 [Methanoregulaceae archaeon]|nr:hypothetical protein [Methanoregulaceae archaeon]